MCMVLMGMLLMCTCTGLMCTCTRLMCTRLMCTCPELMYAEKFECDEGEQPVAFLTVGAATMFSF